MPHSTAPATELTAQYVNQVAADLERNVKEQERITAEITVLQQQLADLQHDHTVLVNMQQALGVAATTPESASADHPTVPLPRTKAAAGPRRQAKTATAKQPTAKNQAAKKSTAKNTASKTAQPTLVELIRRHLTEQSEPRSAAEIATALSQAHPDRGIKTNVVRTTLENLVARSQAQRAKQGSSVYYTAPSPTEPTAAPTSEAQAETAG
ncbi:hypothetical protein SSP24_84230 [Streptomyces spinoverrucosus]|uniref:Regulatory protein n=1 Tax=Streptomyces spinoverrucosus TaxID=284043 RepID=A0A4Y3VX16_9ACTN|nr:hypothetical protein [Streptomyces spinoverrucosus]GEC10768.1 hypothetical protein SSP24_84230 [Streptomyces spinoverrucosus]GHC00221.1 hypothetical protein GCM10010397_85190 [Streptomyces spinoverrucosus]